MDTGVWLGQLEIRQEGESRILSARFPYGTTATVASRGRVRKERFAPGALSWQVREFMKVQQELADVIASEIEAIRKDRMIAALEDALEKRNTHLLVGHDFNRAIADMRSETLTVAHTAEAVELRAMLPPDSEQPSWVRDAVLAVRGGQLRGISPGFNVSQRGRDRLVPEEGNPGVMIREIEDADAYEYSLVARPSYPLTEVDTRNDDPGAITRPLWWM